MYNYGNISYVEKQGNGLCFPDEVIVVVVEHKNHLIKPRPTCIRRHKAFESILRGGAPNPQFRLNSMIQRGLIHKRENIFYAYELMLWPHVRP